MARSEQYSYFVLGASDELTDIYCEPCHQAGHVAIAEGYCVDCPEYLCGPCYKIHRRHKALANHVLLDKDSMPQSMHSSQRDVDICEEKCLIHCNEVIKLFCETCDEVVCLICVATAHRQCEKVKHIPDIVKDFEQTEKFKKFSEDIKTTASVLSKQQEKIRANITFNKEMRTLATQELKRQRAVVQSFFDQLEKKMDEQITALEKSNRDTLKAAFDRLNQMKRELDQIMNDIDSKNTGERCKMFIAMKQSQAKMKTFKDQFGKIQEEQRILHYALVPSEQIQAMMRTTTEICRIATARFVSEIDIRTGRDKRDPTLSGLTIMHGHFCVAFDNKNKCIKVIDANSKCVTSEITIEAQVVWSMTSVSDDQVALSVSDSLLGDRNQMQFFTVSASGVIQRTNRLYDIDYHYFGMLYCAGNMYGIALKRFDKLNMRGRVVGTIHTDDAQFLNGIAASPDGQTLYVIDHVNNSVSSVTLDGEVKAIYQDKDLNYPSSITVDKHGYVYVRAGTFGTGNIQQFTADLNKVQVLIDDRGGDMTYSSIENKLYISAGNKIHLYSLDFKQKSNHSCE